MDYAKLFGLGNLAKDYGLYDIANIVFAILFAQTRYFSTKTADNENSTLWIEWESSDPEGAFPSEVYYDLVFVCLKEAQSAYELCAPAPLIQHNELVAALKRSKAFRENVPHERERQVPTLQEKDQLWAELKKLATKEESQNAVTDILNDTDGQGNGLQIPLLGMLETLYGKEEKE